MIVTLRPKVSLLRILVIIFVSQTHAYGVTAGIQPVEPYFLTPKN